MNEPAPLLDLDHLRLARRLRTRLSEALADLREISSNLHLGQLAQAVSETGALRPRDLDSLWIDEIVEELNSVLKTSDLEARPPQLARDELWVLGAARASSAPRPILRGYVEPVLALPIVTQVPDLVVYFLTIDGEDDLLKREKHSHFGWHYHYLNWKKERSDRILCWDLRAKRGPKEVAALFHEPHAEGGGFSARPDLWGPPKRHSMYEACSPDLSRWAPSTFKQASNDADVVWPLGRTLSLHPNAKAKRSAR